MKISHWQVHNPHGEFVVRASTRWDALTVAIADRLAKVRLPYETQQKLMDLCGTVAGWAKIEADGWIISPVMVKEEKVKK